MTPRQALAALYSEKAATIGAAKEADFLRYREKAIYWGNMDETNTALPVTQNNAINPEI